MALPTIGELLSGINNDNKGIVESDYPFVYAHRFLVAYPETIPHAVQSRVIEGALISTPARTASAVLQYWADHSGELKDSLAIVLADAWIARHYAA